MKTNNRMSMQGIELPILKSLISSFRSINEADRQTLKKPDRNCWHKMRRNSNSSMASRNIPSRPNAIEREIRFSGLGYLARVQLFKKHFREV